MQKSKLLTITSTVICTLLVLCILAYFCVGIFFCDVALNPKSALAKRAMGNFDEGETQTEYDDWWKDESKKTQMVTSSRDGLRLSAWTIPASLPTRKWAIVVHGYRGESSRMAAYAYAYHQKGYNVFLPDLRAHGDSEGDYIGMGWQDRLDIIAWIDFLLGHAPSSKILLHGVSMGGAAVMMATGETLPKSVKVAVEDSGYTSVYDQFLHVTKNQLSLPKFILGAATLLVKIKAKYDIKEADSLAQLAKSTTPTLFVHGNKDGFVPYGMLDKVYEACAAPKQKLLIDGAGHAQSATHAKDLYWQEVFKFITPYMA